MVKKSFNQVIKGNKPVLVDFSAEWCGPCRMMAPILQQLKGKVKDNAVIIKIDVDKNRRLAADYRIHGVPTLIIFKKGKPVWRQSGVVQANQLAKLLEQHYSKTAA